MIGPGKYDDLCEAMLRATEADGILLIVLGGRLGSGFSVTFKRETVEAGHLAKVPGVLRDMATQIEGDLKELEGQ